MFGKSFNFLEHEVRKLGSVAYGIKNKKITKLKNDGHKICKKIEFFYLIIDSSVLKILKKKTYFSDRQIYRGNECVVRISNKSPGVNLPTSTAFKCYVDECTIQHVRDAACHQIIVCGIGRDIPRS